jgi:hypothetical protein
MTPDPISLERLHDIVVPPPVPWWPPAPGWLWLLGFCAAAGLVLLGRGIIRWQRNRYRRDALAELARLEADAGDPANHNAVLAGMSAILKRTAITAYGRERVAALTGPPWFALLDAAGRTRFGEGSGTVLEDAVYEPESHRPDARQLAELAAEVRTWIRTHGPLPGPATGERRAA